MDTSLKNKKILIIEDEAELRKNIANILTILGFITSEASDGKEALEILTHEEIDLVISDIKMPIMDGYELLDIVRKNENIRHIPFIFVTSNIAREQVRKGMELGADDYITKPFSTEEIARAIRSRLERMGKFSEYYETKFNEIISSLKIKAYTDSVSGLPNIVAYRDDIQNHYDKNIPFLLFLIEIDGAEELTAFLSLKSYESIIEHISSQLKSVSSNNAVYSISEKELCFILDTTGESVTTNYINDKISFVTSLINTPVITNNVELSFSTNGGVYNNNDNKDNKQIKTPDEILHMARIAKKFSQLVGDNIYSIYSDTIKEKYNKHSSEQIKNHLHITKKEDSITNSQDSNVYETKIFFLYPQSIIQNDLIKEINKNEYSAYIINDHIKILKILKKYTNSILFINIDSVLQESEWEIYIRNILNDPELNKIRIGIISHNDSKNLSEKYLIKMMLPCGFIKMKSGFNDSLSIILKVLEANEAKGKRKYVRVKIKKDEYTFAYLKINGIAYHANISDISSIGCSVSFKEDIYLRESSVIEEMNITLLGVPLHTSGKIIISRTIGDSKIYVVQFDKNMEDKDKDKIHNYIMKSKQEEIDKELASI